MDALPPPVPALVAASPATPSIPVASPERATGIRDFLPPRDPGTAALLSLVVTGAGQFYNGEAAKGWWMLSPWALYPLAWVADAYFETGYARTGVVVLGLGVKGYSVWDAFSTADTRNKMP